MSRYHNDKATNIEIPVCRNTTIRIRNGMRIDRKGASALPKNPVQEEGKRMKGKFFAIEEVKAFELIERTGRMVLAHI